MPTISLNGCPCCTPPVTTTCCDLTVPGALHVTVLGAGLDGVYRVVYDAGLGLWVYSGVAPDPACGAANNLIIHLYCGPGDHFNLGISVGPGSFGSPFNETPLSQATLEHCHAPFDVVFGNPLTFFSFCSGSCTAEATL